jgi:hypothetical protein
LRDVVGARDGEEVDPVVVYEALGAAWRDAFDEALEEV